LAMFAVFDVHLCMNHEIHLHYFFFFFGKWRNFDPETRATEDQVGLA